MVNWLIDTVSYDINWHESPLKCFQKAIVTMKIDILSFKWKHCLFIIKYEYEYKSTEFILSWYYYLIKLFLKEEYESNKNFMINQNDHIFGYISTVSRLKLAKIR